MLPPLGAENDRDGVLDGRNVVPVRLLVPRPIELGLPVPVDMLLPASRIKVIKPLFPFEIALDPLEARRATSGE